MTMAVHSSRSLARLVLSLALLCGSAQAADPASGAWKAGSAAVVITPDAPMFMAGYAARTKPSEGKANDLKAKALVLEDAAGSRVAIVTTDLIGIPRRLRDNIVRRLEKDLGLPPKSVLLNASHTHCGPELLTTEASMYDLDAARVAQGREYVAELENRIVRIVAQAIERLAPAMVEHSRARCGFGMNRRLPTESGYQNSPNPDGPVDHDVPVLIVSDAEGTLKTVLFQYACHNTTLGFQLLCGDYAGFAQDDLEERHPGITAMFLMGCGGDQNPYPRSKLELAQHHGKTLSLAVETALETKARRPVRGSIRSDMEFAKLEFAAPPTKEDLTKLKESTDRYDRRRAEFLLNEIEATGKVHIDYDYPVQVLRLGGDVTIIALGGETVIDYALRLKSELKGSAAVWVAGYSNDVFGYVPSQRVLREGGYEAGGAMRYTTLPGPFAEDVEERILGSVNGLMRRTDQ